MKRKTLLKLIAFVLFGLCLLSSQKAEATSAEKALESNTNLFVKESESRGRGRGGGGGDFDYVSTPNSIYSSSSPSSSSFGSGMSVEKWKAFLYERYINPTNAKYNETKFPYDHATRTKFPYDHATRRKFPYDHATRRNEVDYITGRFERLGVNFDVNQLLYVMLRESTRNLVGKLANAISMAYEVEHDILQPKGYINYEPTLNRDTDCTVLTSVPIEKYCEDVVHNPISSPRSLLDYWNYVPANPSPSPISSSSSSFPVSTALPSSSFPSSSSSSSFPSFSPSSSASFASTFPSSSSSSSLPVSTALPSSSFPSSSSSSSSPVSSSAFNPSPVPANRHSVFSPGPSPVPNSSVSSASLGSNSLVFGHNFNHISSFPSFSPSSSASFASTPVLSLTSTLFLRYTSPHPPQDGDTATTSQSLSSPTSNSITSCSHSGLK